MKPLWDYELRSERERRAARSGQPVLYTYDDLPRPLRERVALLWEDMRHPNMMILWLTIAQTWPRLTGEQVPARETDSTGPAVALCRKWITSLPMPEVLDFLELAMHVLVEETPKLTAPHSPEEYGFAVTPARGIAILNRLFQEYAVGYQLAGGHIVRVDSGFLHAEVIEPAIALLHNAGFAGPSDEFMTAHIHYRHGRNKEAASDALKAVESTIKAICDARGWVYQAHQAAGALVALAMRNGLIPQQLQRQFEQTEQLLIGLATVRNTSGGHGQGPAVVETPDYLAAYALHQAAANIVLLVEAHMALP